MFVCEPGADIWRAKNTARCTTHCNMLQHTATHHNTLQHAATHCNTLQHAATQDITTRLVIWLIHTCHVTHLCVCVCLCVSQTLIYGEQTTPLGVKDTCTRLVIWLIHMCHGTHSSMCVSVFVCEPGADIWRAQNTTRCFLDQHHTYLFSRFWWCIRRLCVWVQHTATHCNTLQHAATHCVAVCCSGAYVCECVYMCVSVYICHYYVSVVVCFVCVCDQYHICVWVCIYVITMCL